MADVDRSTDLDDYANALQKLADQYSQMSKEQMAQLTRPIVFDTSQLRQQMDETLMNTSAQMEDELGAERAPSPWVARLLALVVVVLVVKFVVLMLRWYKLRQTDPSRLLNYSDVLLVCCPLYWLLLGGAQPRPHVSHEQLATTRCDATPQSAAAAPLPPGEYPAWHPRPTAYPEYPPSYDTARLLQADEDDSKLPPY